MKSAHIASSVAKEDGGPATQIASISEHIRYFSVEPIVIYTTRDGEQPIQLSVEGTAHRRSGPESLKYGRGIFRSTLRAARQRDILHVHGVYQANSVASWLASRLTNTPYIIQPHGTLEPYQQRHG